MSVFESYVLIFLAVVFAWWFIKTTWWIISGQAFKDLVKDIKGTE